MKGRIRHHIASHWAGDASFFSLLAKNLIGVGAVLYAFITLGAKFPIGVLFACLALVILAQIWQSVGTLRAMNRFLSRTDGLFITLCAMGVMAAVHLVNITQMVTALAHYGLDPNLGKYVAPEQRAELSADGKTLHLRGEITYGLMDQMRNTLGKDTQFVTLSSTGGNIRAARAIAETISFAGLNTRATGPCFSACTLIFMAGKKRDVGTNGALGFHSYLYAHSINAAGVDVQDEQAKDMAYLISRGVSRNFVQQAYAVDHDEIWQPSQKELRAAGVLSP